MKTLAGWFIAALSALTMMPGSTEAATPKDGRYKGTMTFRTVVEGNPKAEAKKVIPMAGVLTAGTMVVVMPEVPEVSGKFQSLSFSLAISEIVTVDGPVTTVQVRGVSGNYFTLEGVRATTASIKGSSDFGFFQGTGANMGKGGRYSIAITLTRVGN